MRKLVVYYSRGGTTRRVARELADLLDADLDEIKDATSRQGPLGYLRSGFEALAKGLPAIRSQKNPADYDLVILGGPVWAGTMASPVRSYLFEHHRHIENAALFCTMGGRGAERTLEEMAVMCGVECPKTFYATQKDVEIGRHEGRLRDFVRSLRLEAVPRSVSRVA